MKEGMVSMRIGGVLKKKNVNNNPGKMQPRSYYPEQQDSVVLKTKENKRKHFLKALFLASGIGCAILALLGMDKKANLGNITFPKPSDKDSGNSSNGTPANDTEATMEAKPVAEAKPAKPVVETEPSATVVPPVAAEIEEASISEEDKQKEIRKLKVYIDELGFEDAVNIEEYYNEYGLSIKGELVDRAAVVRLLDQKAIDEERAMRAERAFNNPLEEMIPTDESKHTLYERIIPMPKYLYNKYLEGWYIHYLELCEKYGVTPRECGVTGGAFDHYYELQQMENGNYESYITRENQRARYDKKALICRINRETVPASELQTLLTSAVSNASDNEDNVYIINKALDMMQENTDLCEKIKKLLSKLSAGKISYEDFEAEINKLNTAETPVTNVSAESTNRVEEENNRTTYLEGLAFA
ncbi:hypothetical protein II906_05465 [bacterium]|nr:hypothetical protein [bacterium]